MFTLLLLGIAALALVGFVKHYNGTPKRHKPYVKVRTPHANESKSQPLQPDNFHSVSIVNDGHCCEQITAISGKRFLSKDAPEIPMEDCTVTNCQCRYQHYDDRRQLGNDRRIGFGVTRDLFGAFGEQNRRDRPMGRRATDS
ncbi:hypothetical protein [Shewanella glacialipiscicola]|uniref:Uncharacterized protein n=2 Tax=Shewanella glacialipiscicola TaxID=614069 RepID=A0ABQ6IY60_9GAMM|nr:hypothetical protein [Shewanella glacialipiscicola]MCL1086040.1 hypothetical protein [Shewanella glacialipiscicola]GIU07958.1 hypothetical protein TUM4636_12010 [Shewanella glacialipiscicola]GMA80798.1 hypothetical protein GCM10025855_03310 [Shewanella glacialipiscicola]GMA84680.1 hypothetical protein GCM10025855_42150 [Shewanella glacialipiscicola]